jgi:Leucine-rich repeat (LRR) protein
MGRTKVVLEQINNESIERVSKNPQLEKLILRRGSLAGLDFSPLRQLKNLKSIQLTNFTPLTAFPDLLSNTPNLEKLVIGDAGPFSTDLLRVIASLGSLLDLFIQYSSGFEETSLMPLGSCTTLERITLDGLEKTSIDFEFTARLTNLEKISVDRNEITDCDLEPLAQNKMLRELSLRGNEIEALDLTPLSSCRRFNILDLMKNRLKEIDLTPLAQCDITEFSAPRNQLQRVDLAPLAECANLEEILLFDNKIDDIDLSPLSKCKNLTFIDLSDNRLRSIDLTPLSGCHKLKTLKLYDNPIRGLDTSPIDSLESLTDLQLP